MLNWDDKRKSQNAIKEFIKYKGNHSTCVVLILHNDQILYNGTLDIHAKVETNYTFITINFNDTEEENFYIQYRNDYQVFIFSNNTLLIKARDRMNNDIKIYLS